MMRNRFVSALLLGSAVLWTPEVIAQDVPSDSEEVIVTAQKRSQKLQEVPVAISAFTGKALQDKHVTDIRDLSAQAPGLQVKTDDNAANPKLFIRGIGLNDFNPTTASAVAMYADGVYIGSPLAQMSQFFDLERVEVLRGPQGTLYGRNTTGGAINIIAKKPSFDWTADANIEYGRFDRLSVDAGVGGPIVDDVLAFRLAGAYVKDDGYTVNRLTGNKGNDTDRAALRASLLYTPSSNFTALVQLKYGRSRGSSIWAYHRSLFPLTPEATGADGLCAPGFYTSGQCGDIIAAFVPGAGYSNTSDNLYAGDYRIEGKDDVETFGASATLTWDFGDVSLVAVTGYDHADRDDVEDTDAEPYPVIDARYTAQQWAFSQELRLQSNDASSAISWVAGLYYAHEDLDTQSYYDVLRAFRVPTPENPSGADLAGGIGVFGWPFTQKTDSYAVFGQADYKVSDKMTATLGLRYSSDSKDFDYTANAEFGTVTIFNFTDSKDFSSVSGKAGLQYQLTPDVNLYASYNRGYKSGGFFGAQTTSLLSLEPYDDEKVNAYEIGAKTQFLDRTLTVNASAFYYDYIDLQVYTLVVNPDTRLTEQQFTNASNAEVYGGELEVSMTPVEGLNLTASASYLSASYKDFLTDVANGGTDYSGNRLPNAPRWSLTGSARYEFPLLDGMAHASIEANYRSKVYYDTSNAERLSDKGRVFVDGQLGWTTPSGELEFGIWGRNLFNETNISDIIPIAGLGFDLFSMGPPQSAGLYARLSY